MEQVGQFSRQNFGVMNASDARAVLLLMNADVRHSKAAGVSITEVTALALRYWGFPDHVIARQLGKGAPGVHAVLECGRSKRVQWHRDQAK